MTAQPPQKMMTTKKRTYITVIRFWLGLLVVAGFLFRQTRLLGSVEDIFPDDIPQESQPESQGPTVIIPQKEDPQKPQRESQRPAGYPEITFTNTGWFHPSPEIANNTFRCMASRRFMDAVIEHERFNRSTWTDLEKSPDPTRPILAFLDHDACNTVHWPNFGGDQYTNADTEYGRPAGNSNKERNPRKSLCSKIDQALQSPAMAAPESRLIVLSCHSTSINRPGHLRCLFRGNRGNAKRYEKLVVGHVDAKYDTIDTTQDFGLPPWPAKTVHMSNEKIQALKNCQDHRPIEISFKGRARMRIPEFQDFFRPLNDGQRRRISFGATHYIESTLNTTGGGKVLAQTPKENQTSEAYYAWIMNTTFCPTPRGDELYSVRFSEVLSAGCIPIVYADGWVLPYNQDVVPDWSKMAVLIAQRNVSSTLDVIANISQEERCKMQNRIFDFYNNYVKDSQGRLRAILEMMDARMLAKKEGRDHGRISYAPESVVNIVPDDLPQVKVQPREPKPESQRPAVDIPQKEKPQKPQRESQLPFVYSEITFTNKGWFHPSHEVANTTFRCMVARRFMDAVMEHERFNRSTWTDLEKSPDPTRPILAFLDYDACNTKHWPNFGGDQSTNADTEYGRPAGNSNTQGDPCSKIDQALQSPAMAAPESRLVVLSCASASNNRPKHLRCLFQGMRNETKYEKLVVGHVDAKYDGINVTQDFGLPPWPVKTVHMSNEKIQALKNCQDHRPIEISFKGRARVRFGGFQDYFRPLNDGQRRRISFGATHYIESTVTTDVGTKALAQTPKENQTSEAYYAWIMNTTFCPTPRGDELYSVRFSEVMSAGCIPMVYADGWVLPYNQDVVPDWSKMAVLIAQRNVSSTLDVIANITQEERCKMQNRIFDFYNNYVKDSQGRLRAILEMMDARMLAKKEGRDHGRISYAPE